MLELKINKQMKRKIKNKILILSFTLLGIFLNCFEVIAQCPMCRAAAEQNLASGGAAARGLNHGILYLLITPYLIVGIIGVIWYIRYRKSQRLTVEDILSN